MQNTIKKFIISVVFAIVCHNSFGQDPNTSMLPPPPGVAEIEKYGSIPTTYYTGIPNITIPIQTIQSKSISVPISLSYHAQGIKADDISGPVGLGWSLNGGGYLTKIVYGLEDSPVVPSGFASQADITSYLASGDMDNIYCQQENQDHGVDVFSFSVPGASGKFYYDENDSVRFLPHQVIEVNDSEVSGGTLVGYVLVDVHGTKYFFETEETQEPLYGSSSPDCTYTTGISKTAKLTKITSIDGGKVFFEYDTISYKYLTGHAEFRVIDNGSTTLDTNDSESWSGVDITSGRRLRKIYTTDGWSADLNYTGDGPGKLTDINIYYQQKLVKWFDLTYANYNTIETNRPFIPTGNLYGNYTRTKLNSIYESGKGNYELIYDATPLPQRFTYAQDHWGYYNGANYNRSLIPDKPIGGATYFDLPFSTGSRDPDLIYASAGVLKTIKYPTGGFTSFYYELNKAIHPDRAPNGCVNRFKTTTEVFSKTATSGLCSELVEDTKVVTIPTGSKQVKIYYKSNLQGQSPPRCPALIMIHLSTF